MSIVGLFLVLAAATPRVAAGPDGPQAGPKGEDPAPKGEDLAPKGEDLAPKGEDLAPKGEDPAPKAAPAKPGPVVEAKAVPPRAHVGGTASLIAALSSRRVRNVSFQDASLDTVVRWLRVATGFNFHVKAHALEKAGIDPSALTFTVTLEDVTIRDLMATLFEPVGVHALVKDNIVFLTSRAEAAGKPVTRLYTVSHLTWTKYDFVGPDMNLHPSNFTPEEYTPEVPVENDPLTSGQAVADLVKEILGDDGWDPTLADEGGWSLKATQTYMIVRAPLSVQAKVQHALRVVAALK
jgi:AP-1 complex subunit sigma 1/2